jgi:hypothetical protein
MFTESVVGMSQSPLSVSSPTPSGSFTGRPTCWCKGVSKKSWPYTPVPRGNCSRTAPSSPGSVAGSASNTNARFAAAQSLRPG